MEVLSFAEGRWFQLQQKAHAKFSENQTGGASEKRQQNTFGQHLTDKPAAGAPRAARIANSLPGGGAGQLQAGKIHAGNQQDQATAAKSTSNSGRTSPDNCITQREQAAVELVFSSDSGA